MTPAAPSRQGARRSAASLVLLAGRLRAIGEDPAAALQALQIDPERLDPAALVDLSLERRFTEHLARHLRSPTAGLDAGLGLGIGTYGSLAMLLLTCEHLYASMQTAVRFQRLSYLFSELDLVAGAESTSVRLRPAPLAAHARRFRIDLELAGSWKLMLDLNQAAGVRARPIAVALPYAAPPERAHYERRFGCPVHWGGDTARIEWRHADLAAPFQTADRASHLLLRRRAEAQVRALGPVALSWTERVQGQLMAHAGAEPGMARIAATLGLSERQLRRALQAEGSSLRDLLSGWRLGRAQALLADPRLDIEGVALALGYADGTAFARAYRRWTGDSPSAMRRRQPAPSSPSD